MEGTERLERLLAMILLHDMHDAPQADKVQALNRAGFSNAEIATLLGTSAGTVSQRLYEGRKGGKKKAKKVGKKKRKGR